MTLESAREGKAPWKSHRQVPAPRDGREKGFVRLEEEMAVSLARLRAIIAAIFLLGFVGVWT